METVEPISVRVAMNPSSSGPRLGLFAGCFDPFPHPGHLWAMEQAIDAAVCTSIHIALHIDPSVERPHKSPPFVAPSERAYMLSCLRWVSGVSVYDTEAELLTLLRDIRPSVRILGEDYRGMPFTGDDLPIPIFWAERREGWSATDYRRLIQNGLYWQRPPGAEQPQQGAKACPNSSAICDLPFVGVDAKG